MLLLGVFYSVDKPTMNMYLRPIVDDLLHLLKEGSADNSMFVVCIVLLYVFLQVPLCKHQLV